jgi:hypothetical protein
MMAAIPDPFNEFPPNVDAISARESDPLGLVCSTTSGTTPISAEKPLNNPLDSFLITPEMRKMSRLKRMKKSVLTAARLHDEAMKAKKVRFRAVMITLTYKPKTGWKSEHMSTFIRHCRQYCKRRGFTFRYVWVAELQEKRLIRYNCSVEEAVHYHILVWLPKGITFPKPDKQGWWPHGMTKLEWVRKSAVGYVAKYASKGQGGRFEFPKGCRICGSGGLNEAARSERAWWMLPRWVRDYWGMEEKPRRFSGGGFVSLITGEWKPSPWLVEIIEGKVLVRRAPLPT